MNAENLVDRFVDELERVAGKAHRVDSDEQARDVLAELLKSHQAHTASISDFALARQLNLENVLHELGIELVTGREIARANVGLSGADVAIAETGSLLIGSEAGDWSLVTALPPVHIAFIRKSQIIVTLEEAFALCQTQLEKTPTDFLFVTGPSRTADIELTPVIGVHGPQELIVILLN